MNRTRRRHEIAAAVPVVVVFAALYAWAVPTDGESLPETYVLLGLLFSMPTLLWLFASWLLVHHWWESGGARLSTMDAPGRLLAATVATLPESRQVWGTAMLSELIGVRGRPARWRFALSCARAALFLPLPTRRPVLVIAAGAAVAAVAAAQAVVDPAVPGLGFFAVSFVALVGVMVVLTIARGRRARRPAPVATVLVTGAVVGSVAALAAFLIRHPAAAGNLPAAKAAILAAALAGCLWLAVAPPRRSGASRLAPHMGVGAAVYFVLGLAACVHANREGLPAVWLLFGPMLTFVVPAFVAAAAGRSFRAGVQAGIWTAIAVTPLNYALGLVGALRQHAVDGAFRFAGDIVPAGFTLDFSFLTLLAIPAIGLPFAVMGATAGAAARAIVNPR